MTTATANFASKCQTCGAWTVTHGGSEQPHLCLALDVERWTARQAGWEEGYKFALDNIGDPLVQADKADFGSGWIGLIRQGGIVVDAGDESQQLPPNDGGVS